MSWKPGYPAAAPTANRTELSYGNRFYTSRRWPTGGQDPATATATTRISGPTSQVTAAKPHYKHWIHFLHQKRWLERPQAPQDHQQGSTFSPPVPTLTPLRSHTHDTIMLGEHSIHTPGRWEHHGLRQDTMAIFAATLCNAGRVRPPR